MGRVQRRDFLIAAAALLAAPVAAETPQGTKLPRIGYLMFNSAVSGRDVFIAFRQTMRELGWIEGQNIIIEARFAEGKSISSRGLPKSFCCLKWI